MTSHPAEGHTANDVATEEAGSARHQRRSTSSIQLHAVTLSEGREDRNRRPGPIACGVPIIHAIVLGLVQGFSEFLPISSSGHLLLVPWLFDWDDFSGPNGDSVKKTFNVVTFTSARWLAVLAYFWRDVPGVRPRGHPAGVLASTADHGRGRLAWFFVLAALPAAAVARSFEDVIDLRARDALIIAISLILFSILLGWADRLTGGSGTSTSSRPPTAEGRLGADAGPRSGHARGQGITITAARQLVINRDAAGRSVS